MGGEVITAGDNYYAYNGHGDTTNLLSKDKDSINVAFNATYAYDAFGNLTENTGGESDDNPFRYNGQYTDDETGLIYLRNRYYDPSIGRFTQEDPAEDGLNWYVYCANNPVNMVDPSGCVAYEWFESPNLAAEDWGWNYYAKTDASQFEQASIIYKISKWDEDNNCRIAFYTYGYAVDILDSTNSELREKGPHCVDVSAASKFAPVGLNPDWEVEEYSIVHSHPNETYLSNGDYGLVNLNPIVSIYGVVPNESNPFLCDIIVYHDTRSNGFYEETIKYGLEYDRSYLTQEKYESIINRHYDTWYNHTNYNLYENEYNEWVCLEGFRCPQIYWPVYRY